MNEKLKTIMNKLGSSTEGRREDWGDKSQTVTIWGYIMGREGEHVVIRIADSLLRVKADSIEDIEEVPPSESSEGEGIEVFLKVNETFDVITSAKQAAKLVRSGNLRGMEMPFAIARPEASLTLELSAEDLARQNRILADWQRRIGLFQKFRVENNCTMRSVTHWTTCGINDVGHCDDGDVGHGCEGW
jgi:hypothetical protein